MYLGNVESVQQLVRNQNLNVANRRGQTPLKAAVEKGNERIVSLLIQNGADVNYSNDLLKIAVENGKFVIKLRFYLQIN